MNEEQHHRKLVERYLSRKASEEELVVFFKLLSEGKLDNLLNEQMEDDLPVAMLRRRNRFPTWTRIAAALLVVASALTWMLLPKGGVDSEKEPLAVVEVMPGTEKAILTLPDGTVVSLDEHNKRIDLGTAGALKNEDGALLYDLDQTAPVAAAALTAQYSSVQTPAGGTYRVVLPDNTVVWLNSQSRLTFPVMFGSQNRKVYAEGELYFDVAKDASRPFIVEAKGNVVEVLGTEFNLNAYDDEPDIKTTVIEGRVEVQNATRKIRLNPGQQAVVRETITDIAVRQVDVEDVIAWKNGFFRFEQVDLQTLIRQIARWYNLEVTYEGKINSDSFVGKIPRSENIETVLRILRQAKLDVELSGRKLIIRSR